MPERRVRQCGARLRRQRAASRSPWRRCLIPLSLKDDANVPVVLAAGCTRPTSPAVGKLVTSRNHLKRARILSHAQSIPLYHRERGVLLFSEYSNFLSCLISLTVLGIDFPSHRIESCAVAKELKMRLSQESMSFQPCPLTVIALSSAHPITTTGRQRSSRNRLKAMLR
jgi:hypothetical protein